MDARAIKICYIGGGSRQWAMHLMADLALCPEMTGELVLYDIDHAAAAQNAEHGNALFAQDDARTRFHVRAETERDRALAHADFVVMSIEPGPTHMRYADLEVPRQFGVVQTVGDTVGPGGALRAMRAIPVYEDYAHAVMAHCPDAWVINYTNPMTLCTAALYAAEPGIKAIGCCHEVFGTQRLVMRVANEELGLTGPEAITDRREIRLDVSGLNHFTLSTAISWRGRDLLPVLRERMARPDFFADQTAAAQELVAAENYLGGTYKVPYDMLRRLGAFGSAGSRHLVENVPWYLSQGERSLHRWGVVCTPYAHRQSEAERKRAETAGPYVPRPLTPSGEEGVDQMLALLGIRPLDSNVNLPNRGQMPQLPLGAVVETNACFRHDRVEPQVAAPLPPAAAEAVRRVATVQELLLRGMREQDRDLLLQALLLDPIVMLPTDTVAEMFAQMCEHAAEYLPRWLRPVATGR